LIKTIRIKAIFLLIDHRHTTFVTGPISDALAWIILSPPIPEIIDVSYTERIIAHSSFQRKARTRLKKKWLAETEHPQWKQYFTVTHEMICRYWNWSITIPLLPHETLTKICTRTEAATYFLTKLTYTTIGKRSLNKKRG